MITLRQVNKRFGNRMAVQNVNLTVGQGEIFGLVGPDGAGKTTTIRMLTGILAADSGELTVLGQPSLETIKNRLGYVPQRFSLYGELTVMENIRVLGALYGASAAQVEELAAGILTFTGLAAFANRLADHLSGGMKQKLALAAGLMHKPEILFLDEPTTGVDPVSRREFWQMLYRLNKDGMTIFVSTPYMDEAELCSRVAFMHHGRIVCCDSPQGLKQSYPYHVLELRAVGKDVKRALVHDLIKDINAFGETYHLIVEQPAAAKTIVAAALAAKGIRLVALQDIAPALEDVFVQLAGEEG